MLDARQELRATLVLPEGADPALEAEARATLARRFGRRERQPKDPRHEGEQRAGAAQSDADPDPRTATE